MVELKNVGVAILTLVAIGVLVIVSIFLFSTMRSNFFSDTLPGNDTLLANVNSPQTLSQTAFSFSSATVKNQTWLDFDRVDDFVNVPEANISNSPGVTVSFWMNSANPSNAERILGVDDIIEMRLDSASPNKIRTLVFNASDNFKVLDAGIVVKDTWHFVMGRYNPDITAVQNFLDGEFSTTGAGQLYGNTASNINDFTIGKIDSFFNGSLDEVRLWNRSLNNLEVQAVLDDSNRFDNGGGVSVIMYHNINNPSSVITIVNITDFTAQMAWLNDSGFNSITFNNFTNFLDGTKSLPPQAIIISFDDGDKSVFTNATPIMDVYNFVGVAAIITNVVGDAGRLNWSDIITLQSKGWEIASHSINQTSVVDLSNSDRVLAFNNSKNAIIGNTSVTPTTFIYPGGFSNESIDIECKTFYTYCLGSATLINNTYNNIKLYRSTNLSKGKDFKRVRVDNVTTLSEFQELNYTIDLTTGLQTKLRFNENQGTTAYDVSGNANNGTITGATWNNDGVDNTLTENVDYSTTPTTLTILNSEFAWSEVLTSYLVLTESAANTAVGSMIAVFGTYPILIGLVGTIIFLGLVIFVLTRSFITKSKL